VFGVWAPGFCWTGGVFGVWAPDFCWTDGVFGVWAPDFCWTGDVFDLWVTWLLYNRSCAWCMGHWVLQDMKGVRCMDDLAPVEHNVYLFCESLSTCWNQNTSSTELILHTEKHRFKQHVTQCVVYLIQQISIVFTLHRNTILKYYIPNVMYDWPGVYRGCHVPDSQLQQRTLYSSALDITGPSEHWARCHGQSWQPLTRFSSP
jgi:hypothetical protein